MAKQNYTIVAVERALQVLQKLAQVPQPVGITELSQSLNLSKVAVFRVVSTLMEYDFIIQDPITSLYELGPGVLKLTERYQIRNTLLTLSAPYLDELAAFTQEVVNIGIFQSGKVLVLKNILGRPRSKFTLHIGPVAEVHSTSLGKALVSDKSHSAIMNILGDQPFHRYTRNTITTIDEFLKELDEARYSGIFFDDEETEEGLLCIGTPVRDWNKNVIAAISVSGMKSRLLEFGLEKIKEALVETAWKISTRLSSGYT